MKIPIVIPSYEPDENLVLLCERLAVEGVKDILVINDGSGSEYQPFFTKIEKEYHVTILCHAVNLGKGRGLKNAFNYILTQMPDAIGCVTADSDGQHSIKDILSCVEALRENPDSLILGCRNFHGENNNIPWKSQFGNNITQKICKWLCGVNVSDTQTGLRAIPRDFMAYLLNTSGERFEFETNMLIESKDRFDIKELPIETIYDSKENHKTHFDPLKDSIRIYKIFGRIFGKFLFSSLSSSVLDLLLFSLFCVILRPMSASFYVAIATVIARIFSATYNYLINYKFVFQSKEKHSHSVIKYITLACIQMSCSAILVSIGVYLFLGVAEVVIKIVVDTVLFFISYYIQHEFVFRDGRKRKKG